MNDINKSRLEILSNDKTMVEAIKCLFKEQIEKILPEVQDDIDNRLIGEKYRSYTVARGVLEGVLKDIETYNNNTNNNKTFNKGV